MTTRSSVGPSDVELDVGAATVVEVAIPGVAEVVTGGSVVLDIDDDELEAAVHAVNAINREPRNA